MTVEKTLKQRKSVHGDFKAGAEVSQALKSTINESFEGREVPAYIREAVDCICGKLARIAEGDYLFQDHWYDIQGYARLAEKEVIKED